MNCSSICFATGQIENAIARWAQKTIELGPGTYCRPWVIGPSNMPAITTLQDAEQNVELAVLSAIEHGHNTDKVMVERITRTATAACRSIDYQRSRLYLDLISISLRGGAPEALEETMNSLGFEYHSDFARRYVAEGRAEGLAEGQIKTILKVLTERFGTLTEATQTRVRGVRGPLLDKLEDKMMAAKTLDEILELLK